jgi:hypothetical protein
VTPTVAFMSVGVEVGNGYGAPFALQYQKDVFCTHIHSLPAFPSHGFRIAVLRIRSHVGWGERCGRLKRAGDCWARWW